MMHTPNPNLTTRFLSPLDVSEIVLHNGMAATLQGMADCIRYDFLRWQSFDKSARLASHSALGVIELMPIADERTYTFKYVNGHPGNATQGLPTVMAFGVLADVATGFPLLVSELTLTTALRTAATSALAARVLAQQQQGHGIDWQRCTKRVPGSGVSSPAGDRGNSGVRHRSQATVELLHNLQQRPDASPLRLIRCGSIREAVRGADIVSTITADKTNAAIVTVDMLEPGMHINAVGGDCPGKTEIHPDVLRAARVFVEFGTPNPN